MTRAELVEMLEVERFQPPVRPASFSVPVDDPKVQRQRQRDLSAEVKSFDDRHARAVRAAKRRKDEPPTFVKRGMILVQEETAA